MNFIRLNENVNLLLCVVQEKKKKKKGVQGLG